MDSVVRSTERWVRLSTTSLSQEARLEQWEATVSGVVLPLRCRTLQPRFDASLTLTNSGRLNFIRVTGTPHMVEVDSEHLRAQPGDCVRVLAPLRGQTVFYTGDGVWALQPGQVLVHTADQPSLACSTVGTLEVAVTLSRALYEEAVGPIPAKPQAIGADGTLGPHIAALGRLLYTATRSEASPKPDERAVLELLGALSSGGGDRSTGLSHYEAACGVIERHLADPALGAGYVATRIGISERQLSRVFAAQETAVPQYILRVRLERARSLITSVEGATLTVAEVAHRCGFASASHFSQKFARRFGVPPAELRRQARSASFMSG